MRCSRRYMERHISATGKAMINCIYAKDVKDGCYECSNSEKSRIHKAAQAFCYRCKWRIPVEDDLPPVVDHLPEARQMRIEEWLKEGL